jgi:hypothetical protein
MHTGTPKTTKKELYLQDYISDVTAASNTKKTMLQPNRMQHEVLHELKLFLLCY